MRRNRSVFNILISGFASLTLLQSCYSSQQLVQPTLSKKVSSNPAFLDNVTFASTSRTGLLGAPAKPGQMKNTAPLNRKESTALQVKYAGMLNLVPEAISNLPLYRFIEDWYGTRYRMGGMSHDGIDCSAFVMKMYSEVFGLNLLRTAAEQFSMGRLLFDRAELKEGDLVFFKIRTSRISHVGVYLANNYFVHSASSKGVMVSSLEDKYWKKYYAGGGRVL